MAAYCSHCGTELSGRFCAKCGAPAPDTPGAPPPNSPPNTGPSRPFVLEENLVAALCYLIPVVSGVLFLFVEPWNRNKNVRFHAFQGIFFWVGVLAADVVIDIVFGGILGGDGSVAVLRLIWTLFRLGVLALWLVLMYRAYNRERWVMPVVGEMAQRFV